MTRPEIGGFVVGAARCGTTSLYAALQGHPDAFCPGFKEPRFFRGNQDRGWDWYASLYQDAAPGQLCLDFSPNYMDFEGRNPVAGLIAKHYPQAKLIYLVRHPVLCAISNWQMGCAMAGRVIPFAEALDKEPLRALVLSRARFGTQYKQLTRVIPAKQVLVLPLEGLAARPDVYLTAVQRHLGLPRRELAFPHLQAVAPGVTRPSPPVVPVDVRARFGKAVAQDAKTILEVMGLPDSYWDLSPDGPAWMQA